MLSRTWAYGTTKRAKILDRFETRGGFELLIAIDSDNEGHVLFGTHSSGEKGDEGRIVFTQGGPAGGYWKFHADAKAAAC